MNDRDEQIYQKLHINALCIKRAQKHVESKNLQMTKKYLKTAWESVREAMQKIKES